MSSNNLPTTSVSVQPSGVVPITYSPYSPSSPFTPTSLDSPVLTPMYVPEVEYSSSTPTNSPPTYSSTEVSGRTVTVEQAACLAAPQLDYTEYTQPPPMGYVRLTSPANSTSTCSPKTPDTSGLAVEKTAYLAAPEQLVYPELADISDVPLYSGQQQYFVNPVVVQNPSQYSIPLPSNAVLPPTQDPTLIPSPEANLFSKARHGLIRFHEFQVCCSFIWFF